MAERENHVYQSTALGMPALKMVLVHARNEAQNASIEIPPSLDSEPDLKEIGAPLDKEKAVRKIIEHLESIDR